MPEEIEIDTDSLREKIDEEREKHGGSLLRWVSLTTWCDSRAHQRGDPKRRL
jgi:hypothetical protein